MDIKNLELTENDFKMLVEGLDALPERGMAGEMMGMLLEGMIGDKNPEAMEKYKRTQEAKKREAERAKEVLKDDIRILQGKLLMFKRYLIEIDGLKQVSEILHPKDLK
jgi:hypothetical protein